MAGIMDAIRKAGSLKGLGLEKRHFGVLMVLAFFEDDVTGDCWPSCKTIGLWAGQDGHRVSTNRTQLESLGYIMEDVPRRKDDGKNRKYWLFNEHVFPRMRVANCEMPPGEDVADCNAHSGEDVAFCKLQEGYVANGKMQQDIHCTALHKKEERSKAIDYFACPPSAGQVGDEEESQEAPAYVPVGTTVANAPSVPEAPPRQEGELPLPKQDRGVPTLPVMLHLVALLEKELGLGHPRTGEEPWPTLEADFEKRFSVKEQEDFLPILDWALSKSPHFRKAFADPKKKDLIRFFANNAEDMREDFESHRAKAMVVSQSPASVEGGAVEDIQLGAAPVENREPTLPLGRLFLQCLEEKGLTFHDTSTWDGIEKSLPKKYPAALLLEAPNAIRRVLAGEDAYWYGLMFDGTKQNQFRFFMNNLPKIVKSLQANRARAQLTPKAKEPSNGSKKSNKYSVMVPD
jgi:hypothetical protein